MICAVSAIVVSTIAFGIAVMGLGVVRRQKRLAEKIAALDGSKGQDEQEWLGI